MKNLRIQKELQKDNPVKENRAELDALMIFPPFQNFGNSYYPAPYQLANYANQQGFNVKVWDLNQIIPDIFVDCGDLYVLKENYLKQIKITEKNNRIDKAELHRYHLNCYRYLMIKAVIKSFKLKKFKARGEHSQTIYRLIQSWLPISENKEINLEDPTSIDEILNRESSIRFGQIIVRRLNDILLTTDPKVIGISIPFMNQLVPALLIAREIRRINPNIHICFGGPTMTLLSELMEKTIIKLQYCDTVIRFGGERPFVEIIKSVILNKTKEIRNLNENVTSDEIISPMDIPLKGANHLRYLVKDLSLHEFNPTSITVIHSNGCYWNKCSFCDFRNLYSQTCYQPRPISDVISDIHFYAEHRAKYIWLKTESLPPKDGRAIAENILNANLKIGWGAFLRIDDKFDVNTLQLMAKSGFRGTLGLESTNSRILGVLNKGYTGDQAEAFLERCSIAKIKLSKINIIIDVPSTTFVEALSVFTSIYKFRQCADYFDATPFELTVSSEMYKYPEKFGIKILDRDTDSHRFMFGAARYSELNTGMSESEKLEIFRRYHKLNAELAYYGNPSESNSTHLDFDSSLDDSVIFPKLSGTEKRMIYFEKHPQKLKAPIILNYNSRDDSSFYISKSAYPILQTLAGKRLTRSQVAAIIEASFIIEKPQDLADVMFNIFM